MNRLNSGGTDRTLTDEKEKPDSRVSLSLLDSNQPELENPHSSKRHKTDRIDYQWLNLKFKTQKIVFLENSIKKCKWTTEPAGTKSIIASWSTKPHFLNDICGDTVLRALAEASKTNSSVQLVSFYLSRLPDLRAWSRQTLNIWYNEKPSITTRIDGGYWIYNSSGYRNEMFHWEHWNLCHELTCSTKLRTFDGNCVWHFRRLTDLSWKICENNKIPSWRQEKVFSSRLFCWFGVLIEPRCTFEYNRWWNPQ